MSSMKRIGWAVLTVTIVAGSSVASAQQTCTVTRSQVEADIQAGVPDDEIQRRYSNCRAADSTTGTTASIMDASGIGLVTDEQNMLFTPAGSSTFWEALQACGYHPQREELDCAIDIRQSFGFGGPIGGGPGSHEWVLFCAGIGAGGALVPINIGQVHLHDAPGANPRWDFGVVVQANPALAGLANNGATIPGRAILSWAIIPPANCNWAPVWGNWANFRFRLDP